MIKTDEGYLSPILLRFSLYVHSGTICGFFIRRKNSNNKYDNIQIFIEPKGSHLRKQDAWKEDALQAIHSDNNLSFSTGTDDFEIWGMPFFGEDIKMKFVDALKEATTKTDK